MNNQEKCIFKAGKVLITLTIIVSLAVISGSATGKSLYVLSDINGYPQPLQAYDIAANGTLEFQAEYIIPRYNNGAVGLAIDSDSGYLFVTYVYWNYIILINSETMTTVPEMVYAPGAWNLAGIVYNHKKGLLYCVDRGRYLLWVYKWDPNTITLTPVDGAPFTLKNASAYGIALDEVDQVLYVANSNNKIYAYNTSDWSLKRTITLNRSAVSVAVDVKNGYLYAGGGYVGNPYLTQYHLASNTQLETLVEPNAAAGVIGVAVDPNSSRVYITTGNDNEPGGDNVRVYDKYLHPIQTLYVDGNPTGLVIPGKEIGYNPLGLKKSVLKIVNGDGSASNSVDAGDLVTYRICFSNKDNDFTVEDVDVVDTLPNQVSFVSASDDGVFGEYDPKTHTYNWLYPTLVTGSTACLDITVKVNQDVLPGTTITNSVTVNSNTTPQTTTNAEVVTASNPLNVKKTVFGAVEGTTKWVDVNEVITYNIYLDNSDNNFPATDVIVTDTLPDDLVFIKANEDIFGLYDDNLNTYTWSIPSFAPQESVNLTLTVKLRENVAEGTTVTNIVTATSVETAPASSSVDIRAGQGPLLVTNTQVIPETIRRDGTLSGIMVVLEMPQEYKVKDVKNTPLLLSLKDDPVGITVPANSDQIVVSSLGKTYVVAVFNKDKVMNAIPGYGPKNIQIEGTLTNGGLFAGYAAINITRW